MSFYPYEYYTEYGTKVSLCVRVEHAWIVECTSEFHRAGWRAAHGREAPSTLAAAIEAANQRRSIILNAPRTIYRVRNVVTEQTIVVGTT